MPGNSIRDLVEERIGQNTMVEYYGVLAKAKGYGGELVHHQLTCLKISVLQ